MKPSACVLGWVAVLLAGAASAGAATPRACQIRDDFGAQSLYDCYLSYYYYIPCPTHSWFWAFSNFNPGDIIGAWFEVGDPSMGGSATCDPSGCFSLERFRFLEGTGYANYPYGKYEAGSFAVEYDIYCADENGCPTGPAIWHNDNIPSAPGWTYVDFDPPLSLCACTTQPGGPARVLITVKHVGQYSWYLEWLADNVSTAAGGGCGMHDQGCLTALYPRPANSHYETMHSGYYGNGTFQYCPPQWFSEPGNTEGADPYGYCELAFRIYMACSGPSAAEPVSWGKVKSLYR